MKHYTLLREKIKYWLLWSQKFTKTDMIYLARGSFWLIFGQIIAIIIGLLSSFIFGNFLKPEVFGTYRYLLSLAEIIAVFSLSGLDLAIVPAVARGLRGFLRSAFSVSLKWNTIMVAMAWILATYYFYRGNETLSLGLLILGITVPLYTSGNLYSAFLEGEKKFKSKTIFEIAGNFIRTTGVCVALFFIKNPAILVGIYLGLYALTALVSYLITIKKYKLETSHESAELKFGKHLSLMNLIGVVGEQIDRVLIFQHIGAIELAIYNFASLVPDQGRNIFKKISSLTLPKLVNKNEAQLRETIIKKFVLSTIFLIPVIIAYYFIAPFVYRYLFPQYVSAIPYSQFFAISFLVYGNLGMPALIAKKSIKEKYIADTVPTIIRIIMMVILIVPYGIWGIVISKVVTKILGSLLTMWLVIRPKK